MSQKVLDYIKIFKGEINEELTDNKDLNAINEKPQSMGAPLLRDRITTTIPIFEIKSEYGDLDYISDKLG